MKSAMEHRPRAAFAFSRGEVGVQLAPQSLIKIPRPVDTSDQERQPYAVEEHHHHNHQGYENEVASIAHDGHHNIFHAVTERRAGLLGAADPPITVGVINRSIG
jgi:hypothetical protein